MKEPNWTTALDAVDNMTALCDNGRAQVKELLRTLAPKDSLAQTDEEPWWKPKDDNEAALSFHFTGTMEVINYPTELYSDVGNCFPTHEAAERETRYMVALCRLRAIARKLNGDWKPDWKNETQIKYYICHGGTYGWSNDFTVNGVRSAYFHSVDAAKRAIELMTDEDLKALREGGFK